MTRFWGKGLPRGLCPVNSDPLSDLGAQCKQVTMHSYIRPSPWQNPGDPGRREVGGVFTFVFFVLLFRQSCTRSRQLWIKA